MPKVLIYALNYSPEDFGVGRYTGDIGSSVAAHGHTLHVVTAPPHYPEWRVKPAYNQYGYTREVGPHTSVIRCPILLLRPVQGWRRLLAPMSFAISSAPVAIWQILRHRPDVVFCVEPTLLLAPLALLLGRIVGARTVLHIQDLEVDAAYAVGHLTDPRLFRLISWIEQKILRSFGHCITISERMMATLIAKGTDPGRLSLVRNWVDLDQIRPMSGPNAYRTQMGWSEDLFVALYAGSIGAKQALHVALEAARALAHDETIHFVIVGDGPTKADLVAAYDALPNVTFLPPQPESRMCELLNLADVHLLPQVSGIADMVLPSKLGGMLASGKPIAVTADRGTELTDVLDGFAIIVPVGDSAALASAVETLAHEPRQSSDVGRTIAQQMSRGSCLERLLELLSEAG